jgi:methyl-accepting chemotaxis protein
VATYGRLYNWYAVNTGKLAPVGWHVPTDDDWTILENYLIANGYNYDGTTTENKIAKAMANSKIKISIIINILIVIIGVVIIAIYAMLIKKSVIDPIEKLKNKMEEISSGDADLNKKIDLQTDDEIGEVAAGFNKFLDNMERVILKINETSEKVAKTSIELSKNINLDDDSISFDNKIWFEFLVNRLEI